MAFMETIEQYAQWLNELDAEIARCEDELSQYKARREKLLTDDLVSFMAENGFSKATLTDGSTVEVKKIYDVKAGNKAALAQWLKEHDMGAIIKDSVDFAKGEVNSELIKFLDEGGYRYDLEETIHPQSLKKAVSDWIKSGGDEPPKEAAAVNVFDRVEIKRTKD